MNKSSIEIIVSEATSRGIKLLPTDIARFARLYKSDKAELGSRYALSNLHESLDHWKGTPCEA
jgi:hypothetical protein